MDNLLAPDTAIAMLRANEFDNAQTQAALKAKAESGDREAIEEASREFEAVFMTEMLKPMFEGIEVNGLTGGGKGEEVFQSFMLQEYGKLIASTGNIGIADHVKAAMLEAQGLQELQEDNPGVSE